MLRFPSRRPAWGGGSAEGRGRTPTCSPVLQAASTATAAAAATRPRGRGGAESCAPLWAQPRAMRSAPAAPPAVPGGRSRSHIAEAGQRRRRSGASLQHLPFLPLPSAQIKKPQKAANHPRAKRSAAGGGRSVRRLNSAGGAHNWARAGQGWDAGPGFGEQGLAALLAPLLRLLSLPPRPPLLPPMPQPLYPHRRQEL